MESRTREVLAMDPGCRKPEIYDPKDAVVFGALVADGVDMVWQGTI